MAVETSPGHHAPVDLNLAETHGVFEPTRPLVGVMIPTRISTGVQLPETGLTLTPVDAHGTPLGGSPGVLTGASVLYANTQTDTDTTIKPTIAGFDASTILRSIDSPRELYYRVGLPEGVSLVQAPNGSSALELVEGGRTIAVIAPPSAIDAAGAPVQVSMSASGDVLSLSISIHANDHKWPINVDPELATEADSSSGAYSNWVYQANKESNFTHTGAKTFETTVSVGTGEYASVQYHTQGESKIYELQEGRIFSSVEKGRVRLQLFNGSGGEEQSLLVAEKTGGSTRENLRLCPTTSDKTCSPSEGSNGNTVWYRMEATSPASYLFGQNDPFVYISQEKGPEASADETDTTVDSGRTNVLYGSGQGWLGPYSGAIELEAHDPGIGVSAVKVTVGSWQHETSFGPGESSGVGGGNHCYGIQCSENYSEPFTYNTEMPDGEDTLEWDAWDLAGCVFNGCHGLHGKYTHTLRVDASRPSSIEVTGWPANRELAADSHTLTVSATDGTTPTPSSGVGSLTVSVDGGTPSSVSIKSCTPGPCTVNGSWTLNAEGLTEGVHRLIVAATDNAGNVAEKEFTFDVRHGSPVAAGPGTVDPTTGQFKLSSTDVSLAGAGGVSRTYESRNLTAGAEGPLGPQWAIGFGGGQGITVLPNGSVVLSSSTGGTTTFTLNEEGKFESPLGDGNLSIESKEKEAGKGITEYLLKDALSGANTTFIQPEGTQNTGPIPSNQFGSGVGVQLKAPESEAIDPSGNVWVADYENGRVEKFSRGGLLIAAYGSPGSYRNEFNGPWGIAVNQSTGNVYVTDQANNRIDELNSSGGFVRSFGWGVNDGKAEFEICTGFFCLPGIAGSGNGQVYIEAGIAIDSSGNVWVVDYGNSRIQEFNEKGEYLQKFGIAGNGFSVGGEAQFKQPMNIAFSGGNLYVTDYGNNRVQEVSTSGKDILQFGKEGSGNGEFKGPLGIALDAKSGNFYVTDDLNNRVQEFNASGTMITKFGSAGSGAGQLSKPQGVAVNAFGGIYVSDWNNHRVQEWTRPTWLPTLTESTLAGTTAAYTYEPVELEGKTVIEPGEALAPKPAGVSCGTKPSELKQGCRALTFNYATTTTATGVSPGQWGDYKGHLTRVYFHGWDPSSGKMIEPVVAQYEYDNKGRLRAEWDPRISPALKTLYGYDEEGHVVAVTPPGQEPWILAYGTLASDPTPGRLLSFIRPAASTSATLKEQVAMSAPVNSVAPTLSTATAEIGVTLSAASEGTWSNSALTYSYQWLRCQPGLLECAQIPGAVNKSYTPQAADAGYVLSVQVAATNPAGRTVAGSSASNAVPMATPAWSKNFGTAGSESEKLKAPDGVAVDSEGNVWIADYGDNKVKKFSSSGSFVASYAPDSMLEPVGIYVSQANGNVYVTNRGRNRIDELSPSGTLLRAFGSEGSGPGQVHAPDQLAIDPKGNVYVTDVVNNRIDEFSASGASLGSFGSEGSGNGQLKGPTGIAFCAGNLYVADQLNHRVQEFSLEGKYIAQFGSEGETNGKFMAASEVACEPAGNDLYVTDKSTGAARVQEFNAAGAFLDVIKGSGENKLSLPTGVAVGASGTIDVGDNGNNRIEKWTPTYSTNNPAPAPPSLTSGSVSTIEYNVPLSGSGLPTMTESEVAKWGQQTDDPKQAVAMFPPDKPMGWPASEYERATISYMDEKGHTVNVYTPAGGISTTEYNELNAVVRTLSAANRASALKEANPAEASEKVDTQNKYEGAKLVETLGPEHKVKLAVDKAGKHNEEVMARGHVRYFYDEGAPEGKTYDLVTKTIDGAETASKEEFDKRTTVTSYSGQNNLGWSLRKPTSVTTDPEGLKLTTTTMYDPVTGAVTVTTSPGGVREHAPMVFSSVVGSEGSGNGQFHLPVGEALDSFGNQWITDYYKSRVEELSPSGEFIAAYGTSGTENGQFKEPVGIAVNLSSGNIYVVDQKNNRVEEFSSSFAFIRAWGSLGSESGQFNRPGGLTIDSAGNVWVTDEKNNRIEKFSPTGTFIAAYGSLGSGNGQLNDPGFLVYADGGIYVTDFNNNRVEEFSTSGEYLTQFGSSGTAGGQFKEPNGIAVGPSGNLYVVDTGNARVEEFTPTGSYLFSFGSKGSGNGQFSEPEGIAINQAGNIYVVDGTNNRIQTWVSSMPPVFSSVVGSEGSGNGQFHLPVGEALDSFGNQWITDYYKSRVEELSPSGEFIAAYGTSGTENGQFKEPVGIAVNLSSGNIYVVDQKNNRVEEFSSSFAFIRAWGSLGSESGQFNRPGGLTIDSAGNVWVTDEKNNRIEKFSPTGTFIAAYGSLGSGNGQLNDPGFLVYADGGIYVTDFNNNRVEEFSTSGEYLTQFGSSGTAGGQFKEPNGIAVGPSGNLYVVDTGNARVEEFTPTGSYLFSFGSKGSGNGQFSEPEGIAINQAGNIYVVDGTNNRIQTWKSVGAKKEGTYTSQTIYYSAAANASYPGCGEHPEWANLPCKTLPGAQPETVAVPGLPVSTMTYNVLDEMETKTETFGSGGEAKTRTTTQKYDSAGRGSTSEETSTVGTSLPTVTNKYSSETGALEEQSTTTGGTTKTVTSVSNTLGQLTSYTDADGVTSKYVYDRDGRVTEMNDGKGWQLYAFNAKTGLLTSVLDVNAGIFEATYDVEGKMLTSHYPDGLKANYAYDQVGTAVGIEYVKSAHCATTCPEVWFSDAASPSIHGDTLTQASTLSSESYSYDNSGRLTETLEMPAGKGCTARVYAYDEESNRTSLTTRESGTETCPAEGGTVESHNYDSANRLVDAGVKYDTFGNTTELPAADAGKYALTTEYYVDNQVANQIQNGKTIEYKYDPTGRARETETIIGETKTVSISHYGGQGEALTWTDEGGGKWTRNVPGIDGALAAIQSSSGTTVLQLHDLQGNIVATAGLSETETKLLSTFNSTEYGVPIEGKTPPKYAWFGATGVTTEFATGISTQGGLSYVPQIARDLQTAQVMPPGAFPNGHGTGEGYKPEIQGWSTEVANRESAETIAEYAAEQKAEECELNPLSCVTPLGDPEWVIYTDWNESNILAAGLEGAANLADIIEVVELLKTPIPKGLLDSLKFIADGVNAVYKWFDVPKEITKWAKEWAHNLQRCTGAIVKGEHNGSTRHPTCRSEIFYEVYGVFGGAFAEIPEWKNPVDVSFCKYGQKWCYLKGG